MTPDPLELFVRFGLPVLLFLGGCFIIGWAVRAHQMRLRWPGTVATVTGYTLEEDGGGEGTAYRAMVYLTYALDGRIVEGRGPVASADWSTFLGVARRDRAVAEEQWPVGSAMEIIYDPKNPQLAMPAARRAIETGTVIFGAVIMVGSAAALAASVLR